MSEGSAARFLREVRWSNGVRCVYCSSLSVIGWGWYRGVYRRYRCRDVKASRQIHYEQPLVKGYPRILEISTALIVESP
jgi:transposase-like protein